MFFTNYGCLYDELVLECGEEKAFSKYACQKGRYVLVNAKENATRLFIQTLYTFESADRKYGWWDTFTITKKPQNAGLYIARIDEVRKDKKGYPNFVVTPVMKLNMEDILGGENLYKGSSLLYDFFLVTRMFTEHSDLDIIMRGCNLKSLSRRLSEVNYSGYSEDKICICRAAMHAALNGHLTLKEIIQILLSPTDEKIAHEKYVAMLHEFVDHREEKAAEYPYLVKKLNRMIELDGEWQIKHDIEYIMYDFADIKYDHAVQDGHVEQINGDCFDKAEAYLNFDAERKAKNKAAKKAAKKQAMNESKADNN